jgi:DNA-binding transcriptional LysR family regulator
MKLQDLHILITVVQAGSMGKAAEYLNTSQSAISRSIAELEHALGVRLLDRHRQGIEPTEYGRALLDCGLAVFDDLRRGIKNIEFIADPTAGEVWIGTIPALTGSFVSHVIDHLSRRYPRIVFHLVATELEALHRKLNDRSVDLLIVQQFNLFFEEKIDFEILYDTSYVIVAGARHPWAKRRRVKLADLLSEPWVLAPNESVFGSATMSAFRASGLEYPRATVFATEADARMSLLKSGRFISIFTSAVLTFANRGSELKVLPVELPVTTQAPVGIVTLKDRVLSPVGRLFVASARELAKPLKRAKS